MGLDVMILVFFMFSFKPVFSLSSFTLIKRFFSSSSLSAFRVVSSAYLRLLIFFPATLIPACGSSSPAFHMYSAYELNKQDAGLPCSPPGDLSNPGIEPTSLMSPSLAGGFFTTTAKFSSVYWNCSFKKGFFSLLTLFWNSAVSSESLSLRLLFFASLLSLTICEACSDNFAFLHFFMGIVWVIASCTKFRTSVYSSSGNLSTWSISNTLNLCVTSTI